MIFATIGTQLPFDRMLAGLDSWAAQNTSIPVIAQIGSTERRFPNLQTMQSLTQSEFFLHFERASLVVAHAGMGTILSSLELGKPLVIMPRRAEFGEHRNDHQLATSDEMSHLPNIVVAHESGDLCSILDQSLRNEFTWPSASNLKIDELSPIIDTVRDFIWSPQSPPNNSAQPRSRPTTRPLYGDPA